jgi:hypothetical protein
MQTLLRWLLKTWLRVSVAGDTSTIRPGWTRCCSRCVCRCGPS